MTTSVEHSPVNCLINRILIKVWSFLMRNKWINFEKTNLKWYNRFVKFMCFAVAYQKWHFNGYFWKLNQRTNNQVHWNDTGLQIDCVIELNLFQISEEEQRFFFLLSFIYFVIVNVTWWLCGICIVNTDYKIPNEKPIKQLSLKMWSPSLCWLRLDYIYETKSNQIKSNNKYK